MIKQKEKQEKLDGSEKIKKGDFIELEFTGKIKDGEIFDTNIKSEADKIGLKLEEEAKEKLFIICVGYEMVLSGLDKAFEGKQVNEQYEIEISPEEGFGLRNPNLIKVIPTKVFLEKNIRPEKGMIFSFDNSLARIIAISGGRIITDFNNPMAGKIVVYKFKIKRKIENDEEKINALMDYFFRTRLEFKIEENKVKIIAEKFFESSIKMFSEKFKEMLGKEVVFEEKAEKLKSGVQETQTAEEQPGAEDRKEMAEEI